MAKFHMDTASVRQMGDAARHVADTSLKAAKHDVDEGYDHYAKAKLHGFETNHMVKYLLNDWIIEAKDDITNVRSVGDRLHASANAVAHGDDMSVDEFSRHDPLTDFGQIA